MVACCESAGRTDASLLPVVRAGGIREESGPGVTPALTLPDHTSWSQMSKYGECPKKYYFSYLSGMEAPEMSGAALAGIAVHKIIEVSEEEGFWDSEDWLDGMSLAFAVDLRERIERSAVPVRWGGRKSREFPNGEDYLCWTLSLAPKQLARYQAFRRGLRDNGFNTSGIFSEAAVGALIPAPGEVGDQLYVRGFIDVLLMADRDGEPWVVDYKTGSMPGNPMQLAWYSYLVAEAGITSAPPPFGAMVKLRARDMATGITTYTIKDWVSLVPEMILEHRAAARQGLFPVRPSNFCASCSWRTLCPYGSKLPDKGLAE